MNKKKEYFINHTYILICINLGSENLSERFLNTDLENFLLEGFLDTEEME